MRYQNSGCSRGRVCGLVLILLGTLALSEAKAQTLTTLVNFNFSNGAYPDAGLIADANGNLFGTTVVGGAGANFSAQIYRYGTVFEVPYIATTGGYATTPTTLVSFDNTDGSGPTAGLIADANGNLFGTTQGGGASSYGTVFEVPYNATTGYSATPTTLVSFNDSNGGYPWAGLIADSNGNLFGTNSTGGGNDYGTVFEVQYNAATLSYASTPTLLVSFGGTDGAWPFGSLIADASGNLFGTTQQGGAYGYGTVFEVPYNATTGYNTTPTTLVSFNSTDGAYPFASLIADADGNLFGTTSEGGAFANPSQKIPGYGTVFEVPYNATTGYNTTPTTLVSFDSTGGAYPDAGLIADADGNLFGTTQGGGASAFGTVFELSGSGFVPPAQFAGKPGTTNCAGVSTSTLAHTYGGLAHAATGLHFTSVGALESAITSYCSQ